MEPHLHLPIEGPVDQIGNPKFFWKDGWLGQNFKAKLDPFEKISAITIFGHMGKTSPKNITLTAEIDNQPKGEFKASEASFEWHLHLSTALTKPFELGIRGNQWLNAQQEGLSEDKRNLLFILKEMVFNDR